MLLQFCPLLAAPKPMMRKHLSLFARVEPGKFIVVDDTYRPVRRKLHRTQYSPGGVRPNYSHGTVFSVQKGSLIGAANGRVGRLCGKTNGKIRYYDQSGKRQTTRKLIWISKSFVVREGDAASSVA